ncbi:putative ferredoxin [metagenome]|uniref:Putative ferredoxin n=1 Tax=metagenome TaxID=256318 RepID=A0A2P2C426_9ZZZZ
MSQHPISKGSIRLERDLCIGAGMCESVGARAFHVDDEGLVAFSDDLANADGPLDNDLGRAVVEAAAVCPAQAILLADGLDDA